LYEFVQEAVSQGTSTLFLNRRAKADCQWSEEFKPQARLVNVEEDDEMDME
jgi:hypothetical protein